MNDRQMFIDECQRLDICLDEDKLVKIDVYVELLKKWQKHFNLIGPDTIPNIYFRHILDCAQIIPFIKKGDLVLDIGAGAGLPSIIIAILTEAKVHACERNGKKIQFMREVKRRLNLGDTFKPLQEDVYKMTSKKNSYSVVTSRAFSELNNIIKAGNLLLKEGGKYVLLKGGSVEVEKSKAAEINKMTVLEKKSITNEQGKILIITPSST